MGLGAHLPRLYGVWDDPREIEWDGLPNRFVLKLNNGSGRNYRWFVDEKSAFDSAACVRRMRVVRRRRHGIRNGEFHYAKIWPRIIAEEYLGDDLVDYKFYCFNGSVGFVSAEAGRRAGQHVRDYYTRDFETSQIQFHDDLPAPPRPFSKPANFDEMLALAARLSRGWPFVRVDLYNIAGAVVFGELTFSPESGYTRWNPKDLDDQYGARIDLRLAQANRESGSTAPAAGSGT